MTEFHMYLLDIKSSPSLNGPNNNRNLSSIRLNLLTKTTLKLKTLGGILVLRVLMQVWHSRLVSNDQKTHFCLPKDNQNNRNRKCLDRGMTILAILSSTRSLQFTGKHDFRNGTDTQTHTHGSRTLQLRD